MPARSRASAAFVAGVPGAAGDSGQKAAKNTARQKAAPPLLEQNQRPPTTPPAYAASLAGYRPGATGASAAPAQPQDREDSAGHRGNSDPPGWYTLPLLCVLVIPGQGGICQYQPPRSAPQPVLSLPCSGPSARAATQPALSSPQTVSAQSQVPRRGDSGPHSPDRPDTSPTPQKHCRGYGPPALDRQNIPR